MPPWPICEIWPLPTLGLFHASAYHDLQTYGAQAGLQPPG